MELSLTHQKSLRKIAPSSKHLFVAGLPRHLNKYSRIDRQDEARWLPLRAYRNAEYETVSATRFAPGFCRSFQALRKAIQRSAQNPVSLESPSRRTGWLRFTRHDERGKRNAESAESSYRTLQCGTAPAGALACRRSTAALTRGLSPLSLSSRPGFLGRGRKTHCLDGRYPSLPVPVQRMHLPHRP